MKNIVQIMLMSSLALLTATMDANAQARKNNKKISSRKVVYAQRSPRVATIRVMPKTARTVVYNRTNYRLYNGRFYRTVQGRHIVVAPPRGLRISILPMGFVRINVGIAPFFYYEGVFYRQLPDVDAYEVADAPMGALVYDLPLDAEVVVYDGKVYYEYFEVLYKKVETPDGDAYEVVGQLAD